MFYLKGKFCRPVEQGEESIKAEWHALYQQVVQLHEEGQTSKVINEWVKQKKNDI